MNSMLKLTFVLLAGIALFGCDTGNAPQGLTAAETQKAVSELPPQQQIDYINRSPMPAADKAKKIADIKVKARMK